jgi:hypothetical protein
MLTTRTKPMRIFASDHDPIRLLADLSRQMPADVVHTALREYMVNHREELAALHAETQAFIESGDIDGLTAALRKDARGLAEQMTDYSALRRDQARQVADRSAPRHNRSERSTHGEAAVG